MNIIYSSRLPGNQVKVLVEDQYKLEVRTYPGTLAPKGDNESKVKYTGFGNRFRFSDFAEGQVLGHRIYYSSCNPRFRSIATSALNLAEGSRFKNA